MHIRASCRIRSRMPVSRLCRWTALRWVQANAKALNIDRSKIVVAGDSAGGLLATALGTGLGGDVPTGLGGNAPVDAADLPAAVVCNWPATTIGAQTYVPHASPDGEWLSTPAASEFAVSNVFVPDRYAETAEKTQGRLRDVFAGGLMCFGRRRFGLLPSVRRYPDDDAASVSPLRRVSQRADLPPMLLMSGSIDQVVPCEQTSMFADTAVRAGNKVAHLIFEGAEHGDGGCNCAAGRRATLEFLRHHGALWGEAPSMEDPSDAMGSAMRAFKRQPIEYRDLDSAFNPQRHAGSTLRYVPSVQQVTG